MKFSGSRLRTLRGEANLTQRELAARAGVSRGTVKRLENGTDVNLTLTTLERLADALNISPDDLIDSEEAA